MKIQLVRIDESGCYAIPSTHADSHKIQDVYLGENHLLEGNDYVRIDDEKISFNFAPNDVPYAEIVQK